VKCNNQKCLTDSSSCLQEETMSSAQPREEGVLSKRDKGSLDRRLKGGVSSVVPRRDSKKEKAREGRYQRLVRGKRGALGIGEGKLMNLKRSK